MHVKITFGPFENPSEDCWDTGKDDRIQKIKKTGHFFH